jgi:diphthamide biosynthesis protein 3
MSIYEEVKLTDMRFDTELSTYFYTCPCGDLFEITLEELHDGEDIAPCPSCSLKIRVIYQPDDLPSLTTVVTNPIEKNESNSISVDLNAAIRALEDVDR